MTRARARAVRACEQTVHMRDTAHRCGNRSSQNAPPSSLYPCRHVLPQIGRVRTHYGRGGAVQDMGPNQRGRNTGKEDHRGVVLVLPPMSPRLPPTLNSVVRNFGVSAAECWLRR